VLGPRTLTSWSCGPPPVFHSTSVAIPCSTAPHTVHDAFLLGCTAASPTRPVGAGTGTGDCAPQQSASQARLGLAVRLRVVRSNHTIGSLTHHDRSQAPGKPGAAVRPSCHGRRRPSTRLSFLGRRQIQVQARPFAARGRAWSQSLIPKNAPPLRHLQAPARGRVWVSALRPTHRRCAKAPAAGRAAEATRHMQATDWAAGVETPRDRTRCHGPEPRRVERAVSDEQPARNHGLMW